MASDDINKGQENIRRTLWPELQPMTQISEKNSRQKKLAGDIHQQQHQTGACSSIEDERDDVFSPGINQAIDEMEPADGFQNQDYTDTGRTDEERREAFLADLYEGPYVNIGRPILVPVSRLGRTKLRGTSARIFDDSHVDLSFPSGFRRESPGASVGPAAPDNARTSSTPIRLGSLSVGEAPRSNKTIRLEKNENTGMKGDSNKPSPGAGNHPIFDPSPKNLLALGINGKTVHSAHGDSTMDIDKIQDETAPSTPPPPGFRWEEGPYGATPGHPRTVRTTPAEIYPHDGEEPEESPTLRLQMGRLHITSAGDFDSAVAAGSGSFGHYSGRAHSSHPYCFGYPVPRTPTKGKRARGEFEKTTTLSGRDVAREREILARFAAAAKDDDEDEDEEDEMEEGEVDEEDGELTPKASVLNRHMDIDEE
ncbi:hypothetical protein LX36DRAFT_339996 [Colletotrichum falcatum]|nr:hypothetical protein LX36DRAFT_339996 [Colletotrichum falcatum]